MADTAESNRGSLNATECDADEIPRTQEQTSMLVHVVDNLVGGGGMRAIEMMSQLPDYESWMVIGLRGDQDYRKYLSDSGVKAIIDTRVADYVGSGVTVILHRSGNQTDVWDELLSQLAQTDKVRIVERNIFGYFDPGRHANSTIQTHVYNSCHSLWRSWVLAGRPDLAEFLRKRTVIYNPVEIRMSGDFDASRRAVRNKLGVPEDAFLIGDICRPAAEKLSPMLWSLTKSDLTKCGNLHVVTMSFPEIAAKKMQNLFGPRYINLEPSFGKADGQTLIAALDAYCHFSSMGESFGMSNAEALALGTPVIANLTPGIRNNNAQYEMIDVPNTGSIANTPRAFVEAILAIQRSDPAIADRVERGKAMMLTGIMSHQKINFLWNRLLSQPSDPVGVVSKIDLMEFAQSYDKQQRRMIFDSFREFRTMLRILLWRFQRKMGR